jgi:putative transposase
MIRDRGPSFTPAFDAVLADAGIRTVLCNLRTPRMNAIAERWIGDADASSWTAPLSGTGAICNSSCSITRTHHNQHRPHRFLHAAAPLKPLPGPVDLEQYRVRRQARVGGLINEYRLVV